MLNNLEEPSEYNQNVIRNLVLWHTLEVFQTLNKKMNQLGLFISIGMDPAEVPVIYFSQDNRDVIWIATQPSALPCVQCGGKVFEFSFPTDIWNKVIRPDGHETENEYLCMSCFLKALRQKLGIANT